MQNDFDSWMWKGDEMRLFRAGETIPNDWYDAPDKFNGADPKALDLDGDGRAGGSLAKRRGRPPKAKVSPGADLHDMADKEQVSFLAQEQVPGIYDGV